MGEPMRGASAKVAPPPCRFSRTHRCMPIFVVRMQFVRLSEYWGACFSVVVSDKQQDRLQALQLGMMAKSAKHQEETEDNVMFDTFSMVWSVLFNGSSGKLQYWVALWRRLQEAAVAHEARFRTHWVGFRTCFSKVVPASSKADLMQYTQGCSKKLFQDFLSQIVGCSQKWFAGMRCRSTPTPFVEWSKQM